MWKLLLFHPEMISAQFLWGNVFLKEELLINRCKKFKFWHFWERPLFEIWEYAFNYIGLKITEKILAEAATRKM